MAKKKTPVVEEVFKTTVRLRRSTAATLRVACAERSIDRAEPYTQNAIIHAALEQWLRNNGYRR